MPHHYQVIPAGAVWALEPECLSVSILFLSSAFFIAFFLAFAFRYVSMRRTLSALDCWFGWMPVAEHRWYIDGYPWSRLRRGLKL